MSIPRNIQAEFYRIHLEDQEREYELYLISQAQSLYKTGRLFAGKYVGFDKIRGNILVRFKANNMPRRKNLYTCFKSPEEYALPNLWSSINYLELRKNAILQLTSDCISIFFTSFEEDPTWVVVGFSQVEMNLVKLLQIGNTVIVAEHEPPRKYLLTLEKLTLKLPESSVIDSKLEGSKWVPEFLTSKSAADIKICQHLDADSEVIIQGPPGTGKTYLVAQICEQYLNRNKSVIVTALTNRALMEVAEMKHLNKFVTEGRVLKKALTGDERVEQPHLQQIEEIAVVNGSLILTTYYSLCDAVLYYPNQPVFDLLVIEEASQAFLGTIAMFKTLARKVIIIGDHIQLSPIWKDNLVAHLHPKIAAIANGLATYANTSESKGFRLVDTYRLPSRAARLTGMFYENSINSVAKHKPPFNFILPDLILNALSPLGGASVIYQNLSKGGKRPEEGLKICKEIVLTFIENHPESKIAILSPFRPTNSYLQANIYPLVENLKNVIIETIDRIQGLTVDFTVFLIPFDGLSFSFDLNRFNVATSRSRTHTLLVMDEVLKQVKPAHGLVGDYLGQLTEF